MAKKTKQTKTRRSVMRRTLMVVAFLGFAVPAVADCGWVLWTENMTLGETNSAKKTIVVDSTAKWGVLAGHDQFAACKAQIAADVSRAIGEDVKTQDGTKMKRIALDDHRTLFEIAFPDGSTRWIQSSLICLPAGVDPRAPAAGR